MTEADVRYGITLALLMTLPGHLLYWFSIHGFIHFWRRLGPAVTLSFHCAVIVLLAYVIWGWRSTLLTLQFGTNPFLIAMGVPLIALSFVMRVRIFRHLSMKTLVGLPEIAPTEYPSGLLTEGGYSHIRHPRYVEVVLGLFGCAAVANYLASYVLMVLFPGGLCLVVLLEEKELRERVGTVYETYARRVPPFVPANIQRPWW
jgi:protein-S-isoprenylcysteine O-methyltransferase Ste14